MTAKHTSAHLVRSILKGAACRLNDCLGIMELQEDRVAAVRAAAGGAKSPLWRAILAGVPGKPVATLPTQEGSAVVATLLATVGKREFASVEEACRAVAVERRREEPDEDLAAAYPEPYPLFGDLYQALQSLFPRM